MSRESYGGSQNHEAETRASNILRYIENILKKNQDNSNTELLAKLEAEIPTESDPQLLAELKKEVQELKTLAESNKQNEDEVREYYKSYSSREKADILYEKMMAYTIDKNTHTAENKYEEKKYIKPFEIDNDLAVELKILLEDKAVRDVFSQTYADARIDAKSYRQSELGQIWKALNARIKKAEDEFHVLERALFLKTVKGRSKISATKSKAAMLAKTIINLKNQREDLRLLNSEKTPHIQENTDAAANFQFETLMEYQKQLRKGFIWLDSRKKIHEDTVAALQNGRWPVLIGEAGTGKSDQADAAALELTGSLPTNIQASSTTGERQLIGDVAIDSATGGSYTEYGPLMRAYTGFNDSRDKVPVHVTGRVVRIDESGRLGPQAYGEIKGARQKSAGDDFYGHPVLPGAAAIWTTNPVGPRYPDRHPVDPAMRRELAEIYVDYPDQSNDSPEEYEFMLAALLDENGHIAIAKEELAPAYSKKEFTEDERRILPDGRIVIAEDNLIEDGADKKHGTLWRLANAIKALQNSFVYGNQSTEKIPNDALRFTENSNGEIEINKDTGEILTLSSSTITLGEMRSWMTGFQDRLQKQNESFQVESFSEWIKFKLDTYLKQVDHADKGKIEAIFNYYHLLDDEAPNLRNTTPLTPKQIGYLSPRVPRPLYTETPKIEEVLEESNQKEELETSLYETIEVTLENGDNIRINKGDRTINTVVTKNIAMEFGSPFMVEGETYNFSGTLENNDNKPVGSFSEEPDLHKEFSPEEVELGMIEFKFDKLSKDIEKLCEATQA